MNATTTGSSGQISGSRRQFWIAVAMFFGPLAAAFFLYYGLDGWRPAGSTAHGELIDPARPLPELALADPSGAPVPADLLRGKWSLVYLGAGSCDARCRQALTDTRQVRLALGDDQPRVQRVFLYAGDCCDRAYFESEHPGLVIADLGAGSSLLAEFPSYDGVAPLEAGRTYIVDPLGNLMMSYPADVPAKGMLEDMKKLLKLSHIG
jgi:hypothetical protein